jgi:hypothetical protein
MPAPTKDSAARRHKFTSLAKKAKNAHVSIVKKQIDFSQELEVSPPPRFLEAHPLDGTSSQAGPRVQS